MKNQTLVFLIALTLLVHAFCNGPKTSVKKFEINADTVKFEKARGALKKFSNLK